MKLHYYENHCWEHNLIKAAKDAIYSIHSAYPHPSEGEIEPQLEDEDMDEVAKHIMKQPHCSGKWTQRQQAQSTELGMYLNSPSLPWGTDILDFWKVCTMMFHFQFISSYLTLCTLTN